MSFGDFLENTLLDLVFGGVSYAPPATIYLGLSTAAPGDDGATAAEPPGANGYARVAVTNNLTNFPAASAGAKSNGTAITFPTATGAWGTVTHALIYDAATAGNFLGAGALAVAKTIDNGDTASLAVGDLDITLD